MHTAVIRGTGHYTPEHVLTNADLEKIVDTSDEWILTRTGIKERRVLNGSGDIGLVGMASNAARRAIEDSGLEPGEIEAVIMATVTPDYRLPSTATLIQHELGIGRAALLDVVAACTGFIYGLSVARAFIASGMYENILVVGGEYLTSITNYEDRTTCVLFGDGAGAAVLSRARPSDNGKGILATYLSGDGQYKDLLHIPLGGSAHPLTPETASLPGRHVHMDGRDVFKLAVREMADAAEQVLKQAGCVATDIDMVIPHQANDRIIEALRKRLDIPVERVFKNIEKYGNTSSASVPIALDEARRSGAVKEGSLVLSAAFGGGLVWGAVLFRL